MALEEEIQTREIQTRRETTFTVKFIQFCSRFASRRQQRIEESHAVGVSGSDSSRSKRSTALQLRGVRHPTLLRQMVRIITLHTLSTSSLEIHEH